MWLEIAFAVGGGVAAALACWAIVLGISGLAERRPMRSSPEPGDPERARRTAALRRAA
jgi:uncharacterized iron-regulated membrane protein